MRKVVFIFDVRDLVEELEQVLGERLVLKSGDVDHWPVEYWIKDRLELMYGLALPPWGKGVLEHHSREMINHTPDYLDRKLFRLVRAPRRFADYQPTLELRNGDLYLFYHL